jgi:hypothetical protein
LSLDRDSISYQAGSDNKINATLSDETLNIYLNQGIDPIKFDNKDILNNYKLLFEYDNSYINFNGVSGNPGTVTLDLPHSSETLSFNISILGAFKSGSSVSSTTMNIYLKDKDENVIANTALNISKSLGGQDGTVTYITSNTNFIKYA